MRRDVQARILSIALTLAGAVMVNLGGGVGAAHASGCSGSATFTATNQSQSVSINHSCDFNFAGQTWGGIYTTSGGNANALFGIGANPSSGNSETDFFCVKAGVVTIIANASATSGCTGNGVYSVSADLSTDNYTFTLVSKIGSGSSDVLQFWTCNQGGADFENNCATNQSYPITMNLPASGPSVTSISPTSGPAAGGTSVTISGSGFTGATAVKFGTTAATGYTVNTDSSITATSPAHAAGTVDVTVTTGSGTSATGAADHFTFNAVSVGLSPTSVPAATVGVAYSQTLNGTGGTSPYTFAVTAGALPAGLTLSSAGVLSGTPTAGGSFNFTVTATDHNSATGSQAYSLTVNAPTISLSPSSLPSGTQNASYSQTVSASGGTSSYSFAVTAGALPTGVTLSGAGALSGTPTVSGNFNFTITATDSSTGTGPYTGSKAYSLTIAAASITVSPSTLPAGTVAASYSQTLSGGGGTGPYSFAVTAGALPAGLTLNSSTGVLSGTPTAGGSFSFTVTATDANSATGSQAYSLTINAPTITIAPNFPPNQNVGQATSLTFTASGGTGPYTYAITAGALPSGISLNSATGVISGTATQGGTFNFTITATDSSTGTGPYTGSHAYTLVWQSAQVSTSPTTIPNGTVGVTYSQTISGTGGTGPYTFQITGGALPAGLSLNGTTGVLSGTPTAAGNFTVFIVATDSSTGTGPYFGGRSYSFSIAAPTVAISPSSLPGGTVAAAYSQSVSGSGGTAPYSYAVTAGSLPTGVTLNASTGAIAGTPTAGGTFNFTITTTDSTTGTGAPFTASQAYSIVIAAPTITISPNFPANQTVGQATNLTFTASGGTGPYTFAVTAGSLPAGITLSSAGVLSGTATQGGTFNFTITATDSSTGTGPYTGSHAYTLLWQAAQVSTSPTSIANGTVGTAYSQTISGTGGTSPYTFQITGGALPAGLSLNGATGVISGTPTAAGSFTVFIVATDSSTGTGPYFGGRSYSFSIAAPTIVLSPSSVPAATVGANYSQTLSASGGTSPYSYAVTAGALPAGVTLNSSTGVISGRPTAGGTFNFTVTATDSSTGTGAPFTASHAYSMTVNAPTITVSPSSVPGATVGASYSQTITASGGTSSYTFAVTAGALPAGMTLSSAGVLSGTPTAGGSFSFTVTATDSSTGTGPYTGSRAYSLTVAAPTITVSPSSLPSGTVAASYSQAITASGGTASYTFAVTAGSLPAGMTLSSSGTLSGTPHAGGTFNFTVTATDSSTGTGPYTGSRAYSLTIAPPTITVSPTSVPAATVGASYSQTITASGGTSSYTFAVTAGALPAGMTLTSAGVLSGTPTAGGSFNFTVTATDSSTGTGPYTGSRAYSMTVAAPTITVSPSSLPGGAVAASYSQTISASGGTSSYTFAVTAGSLPAGMSLSSAGALTGTPTAGGTFNFTVTATDSSTGTGPYTGSRAYSLVIAAPTITVSPASLASPTVGVSYSQSVSASGGTSSYSFAVTSGALPTGLSLNGATGAITGTPTAGGTFNFTITATDSSTGTGPYTGSRAYSLTVGAPTIVVSPPNLVIGAVGASYSSTITASGGTAGYSFAVTAGSLPAGVTLSGSGTLSGTPTAGGTFNFTVTATDSSTGTGPYTGSRAYSLTIAAPTITVSPPTLPAATVGVSYSQTVSASGGTSAYSFAVTAGALPAGVTLTSAGVLSGTPTAGGTFTFTITATDSSTGTGPYTGSRAYSLTVAAPTIVVSPSNLAGGVVGTSYSQTITASGGTAGYTFAVTAGSLPAGMTFSSAGVLSGTPTAGGTFNFTVTATDSSTGTGPYTGSRAYSLTIAAPTITVSPSSLPSATVGLNFSQTVSASGGTPSYTFAVTSGALPAGLSLNSTTGAITGAPTAGGTFNFTITATDSSTGTGPYTGSRAYAMTVNSPVINVSPANIPPGVVGQAYSQTITASGGTAGYTFSVTTGALPPGVTLSSSGVLSGTPTAGGLFGVIITATDSSTGTGPYHGSRVYSFIVSAPTVAITPTTLPNPTVGAAYSQTLSGSGGTSPYGFAVTSGALPTGLSLTGAGVLSGTPTAGGSFTFTVTATDSTTGNGPYTATRTYTVTVSAPTITVNPSSLPSGTAGANYSQALSASGGVAGYSFAITSGSLPAGVSLSSSGTLSGVPTAGGTFNFTVTATDSSTGAGPYSGSRAFSLTIGAPTISISPGNLPAASSGAAYSQSLSASGGVGPRTFAVTGGALPPGLSLSSNGTLSGTPTGGGTYTFTVTATDSSTGSEPFTGAQVYNLTVGAATIAISPSTLPAGVYGSSYTATLTGSGGAAPYSFSLKSGSLPTGLTLGANGAISGTPTQTGAFQFTVGATDSSTGTGPFSGQQVVNLTINNPPPPATANNNVTVTFNSNGSTIDLSGSVTGNVSSISIVTPPAHGTVTVSGLTVTYTPTPGYYGPDSFTYKATGMGGDSSAATVQIVIPTPAPTAVADKASTPANQAVTIPVTTNDTGPITSIAVASQPAHGTAAVNGLNVVYTPAANFFGVDTFTYTDTGPGGQSSPATVTVTVAALPAPTVVNQSATVVAGSSVTIHVTTGATGSPFTAVAVATQPAQGTATVNGMDIVYTAPATFSGKVTFTYTVANPFGVSQPGTVTVTVNPLPMPQAQTVTLTVSQTTTVDLTQGATGGPFTGASIISLSPSNAGTVQLVQSSSSKLAGSSASTGSSGKGAPPPSHAAAAGIILSFTPAKDYVGSAVVTFTLSNAYGTSAPSTVTFIVTRPDPTRDPNVTGLISAQNEEVRRMAEAQLNNFNRRLEDLHRPDGGKSKMGVSFNFGDYSRPDYLTDDPDMRRQLAFRDGGLAETVSIASTNVEDPYRGARQRGVNMDRLTADRAQNDNGQKVQLPGGLAVWASGSVDFGQRNTSVAANRLKFTTAGVTFGVDAPVGDRLILGGGVGYGETDDNVGSDGVGHLGGRNFVGAVYGSWEVAPRFFLDGVAGGGTVHFDTRRLTASSTVVNGARSGQEGFGSITATYEFGKIGELHFAPYGRMDVASASLSGYSETGDPVLGLTFQRQNVQLLTGDLGLRGDYTFHFRWGEFSPRVRMQYRHDFEGAGSATYYYTSLVGQNFTSSALPIDHDVLNLGVGGDFRTNGGYRFSVDYEDSVSTKQEDDHQVHVKIVIPWK